MQEFMFAGDSSQPISEALLFQSICGNEAISAHFILKVELRPPIFFIFVVVVVVD